MKMRNKIIAGAALLVLSVPLLAACTSDADRASENLSTAAEQFEITRHITAVSGITDTIIFEIEGRCSVESANSALAGYLELTCKIAEDEYLKSYILESDNLNISIEQVETVDVSVYNYRWIIKPQNIIPNVDIQSDNQ